MRGRNTWQLARAASAALVLAVTAGSSRARAQGGAAAGGGSEVPFAATAPFGAEVERGWFGVRVEVGPGAPPGARVVARVWGYGDRALSTTSRAAGSGDGSAARRLWLYPFAQYGAHTLRVGLETEDGAEVPGAAEQAFALRCMGTMRGAQTVARVVGLGNDQESARALEGFAWVPVPLDPTASTPIVFGPQQGPGFGPPGPGYAPQPPTLVVERVALVASEAPDRFAAYAQAMVVVVLGADLAGEPAAASALADWVRLGGSLLVVPPSDPAWFETTPLRALLPLARSPRLSSARGRTTLVDAPLRGGRTELSDPSTGLPLVQTVFAGEGTVRLVSWPIAGARLDPAVHAQVIDLALAAAKRRAAEEEAASRASPRASWLEAARSPERRAALRLAHTGQMPSILVLIAVVLVYIVVVGPLNYVVLVRRGVPALTVVTVPILALLFVAITFAFGYATKGSRPVSMRLAVLRTRPERDVATERVWVGVYSSGQRTYDVALDPRACALPLVAESFPRGGAGVAVEQGDRFRFPEMPAGLWESAAVEAIRVRDLGGAVELKAAAPGPAAATRVTNGTRLAWRGGYFATNARIVRVPALLPGDSAVLDDQRPLGDALAPLLEADDPGEEAMRFRHRVFEMSGIQGMRDEAGGTLLCVMVDDAAGTEERIDGEAVPAERNLTLLVVEQPKAP